MSLRARMGIAAGVAVALAVIAVAVSAYVGTRSQLRGQVDQTLRSLAAPIVGRGGTGPDAGSGPVPRRGGGGPGPPPGNVNDCDRGLGLDTARGGGFGGAQGYVQLVDRQGKTCLAAGETTTIPFDHHVKALAASGSGSYWYDTHVGGHHLRILASGVGSRGALEIALPLTDVDKTLRNQLLLLVVIAAAGTALAALLGLLVARAALAPIARFTRQAEEIASTPERSGRLEVTGSDELARLASTFNMTLDALERSIDAQRNLVADASHELRTPIASLRANLQLLRDEQRLGADDRSALRQDMINELDELTALVSDVVELARGAKPSMATGEVRVDTIVASVVERERRRVPQLQIETALEPTMVQGDGDRIARTVANLLDNARKWSPPDGVVEVTLKHGALTVRDHGPGFHEEDLPHVFDRFHRARDARSKPGSGLGLAIVRQAAEAHGGAAEADNAPGGGAILKVSFGQPLPLDADADAQLKRLAWGPFDPRSPASGASARTPD